MSQKTIWTIGHSTRPFDVFVGLLHHYSIQLLVDVRSFPGSRKYPQFNKEALELAIPENGIEYIHMKELGGRRKVDPNSKNTAWRHEAFRGYADYMETEAFQKGIEELEALASKKATAYMCSEAVWWRCHRSMISDILKLRGWRVLHIMSETKAEEHPYTGPARIVDGQLRYDNPSLFDKD
jgi:uncharacterized protein (DUF488 family)